MMKTFKLDGKEFTKENFTKEMTSVYDMLVFTKLLIEEATNEMAILNKAKNGYLVDLKTFIINEKTGIDIGTLLDYE